MPFLFFNDQRLRPGWRILLFFFMLVLLGGITFFPVAALLLSTWFMARFVDRRPLSSVGLALERASVLQFLGGLALGAGLMATIVGVLLLTVPYQWQADGIGAQPGSLVFFSIVSHFGIAAFEELLARGYLFQTLIEGIGTAPALMATAVGFASLHLDNPHANAVGLVNLCLAGLLLGTLVLRTKALWMAIGFHQAWNWAQSFAFGLPVSGYRLEGHWLGLHFEGPAWLSGGEFGPEASVVTTLALAMLALWAWKSPWLKPGALSRQRWDEHVRARRWTSRQGERLCSRALWNWPYVPVRRASSQGNWASVRGILRGWEETR